MRFAFESFELDVDRAELRRDGEPVPIEPQVFDLLHLLVSAGDRMVTREEIFERIWGDRIVSDAALSSRVRDVRRAIGDDGRAQRLIRTVHSRGLRFVGQAAVLDDAPEAPPLPPAGAAPPEEAPCAAHDPLDRPAVAVLPFEDLSDAPSPMLADAVADEVAAALAAWRSFPVISRNSAFRFRASPLGAPEIGAALRARYLVSGSIRRTGGRIKVQAALVDAQSDRRLWDERFARDLDELRDVEEEIAAQVAAAIVPELEGAEARRAHRRPPGDLGAWELAMRASWLIASGLEHHPEAERLALRAAELAPGWALPLTLIATARFQQAMSGFSAADSRGAFSSTLEAARQALDIDRGSWVAHALAAVGELWTNRNHERALLHVTRAIELNPSAAVNYHFGGCITGFSGDPGAARAHQERLFRLDPVYPYRAVIEADLGLWHLLEKSWDAADERLTRARSWDPAYGRAHQRRIALAGLTGDRDAALEAARRLSDLGLPLEFEGIMATYPFRNPDHAEMFGEGLRRSGVNFRPGPRAGL
ncbi:winged helix-turn-helix domain-containing protein [Albimonas pacifica]|uniref:TolB amino-terminal domain-containing protein n=1 Tax=Albimonas pacifica TaxID=1114924 RepID=A0A1I3BXY2_9RHOB|nr:winged helix-turn-helix domain-containing protein [Albimonas pacifica]SFH67063.1 TolB amino-terminal domain-containing protein [Albimonas pacifica]